MTKYPLAWPHGWKRMQAYQRKKSQFKNDRDRLSVAQGVDRVLDTLKRMGIGDYNVIISTNIEPTLSGRPRSAQAEPSDPGVAVYWKKSRYVDGKSVEERKVMAVDRYTRVADNLAAIAATLEAMRAIERHGGAAILDRAFTGFEALPAPKGWREVLGVDASLPLSEVGKRYKVLAFENHPDRGGSHERMAEINHAWDEAQKELS